jgi:hypothetical protein
VKVLDLFSCEGGAGTGYVRAGLALAASVDLNANALKHNPNLPHHCGDWREGLDKYAADADLIHASPPCQGYVRTNPRRGEWPLLVNEVRDALEATGKAYVIENVPDCEDLHDPVWLTGCMFGLTVTWDVPKAKVTRHGDGTGTWVVVAKRTPPKLWTGPVIEQPVTFHLHRKRGFEVRGFELIAPDRDEEVHSLPTMTVIEGTPTHFWNHWYAATIPSKVKCELLGTPWMTNRVAESIPPAYTEHIGKAFLKGRLDV